MCQQCKEQEEIDNRFTGFKIMGKFFGYPDCCIEFFVKRAKSIMLAQNQAEFDKACNLDPSQDGYTQGFIPCVECAKKYPSGQEFQLIKNRICSVSYPHGFEYPEFEKEFDTFIQSLKTKEDAEDIIKKSGKKSVKNHNG